MATEVLRPNGDSGPNSATLVGAATFHAALSDNSNASYAEFVATPHSIVHLNMGTFTLPVLAQVRSVRPRVFGALAAAGVNRRMLIGFDSFNRSQVVISSTTPASYEGQAFDPSYFGGVISQATIDNLGLSLQTQDVNFDVVVFPIVWFYEAYVDVLYNEAPVSAVTGPTGTITTRSDPPVVWTYTDPEADAQERYQVKIFTAAQYGIGGFNPETSPYSWSSGEVFSSALTVTPAALPNATYRAYVKVADVGSSGRYGAWAFGGYVLNVTPVPTPTLVATADPTLSRVQLATTVGTYAPGAQKVTVERSTDGGATWATVRGAFEVVTADLATFTVYDYEMPRGPVVSYRVRVVSDITGGRIASLYSTTATVTVTATGWWLKDPQFPALNMLIVVAPGFAPRRKIPQTVYEGLGATTSVVVTDGARGYDGSVTVWCKTAERYAKLDALIDSARPLLLENNLGQAWFVQIGDASSWQLIRAVPTAGETSPVRHFHSVSLPWTQVAAPAGLTQGAGTPTG